MAEESLLSLTLEMLTRQLKEKEKKRDDLAIERRLSKGQLNNHRGLLENATDAEYKDWLYCRTSKQGENMCEHNVYYGAS